MVHGMCWIYKRAWSGDQELDYRDGTNPVYCAVNTDGKYPIYTWDITSPDGEWIEIDIPLNVPHEHTNTIVNKGQNGTIRYEFLYGKFQTLPQYYVRSLIKYIPILVLGILIGCKRPVR